MPPGSVAAECVVDLLAATKVPVAVVWPPDCDVDSPALLEPEDVTVLLSDVVAEERSFEVFEVVVVERSVDDDVGGSLFEGGPPPPCAKNGLVSCTILVRKLAHRRDAGYSRYEGCPLRRHSDAVMEIGNKDSCDSLRRCP